MAKTNIGVSVGVIPYYIDNTSGHTYFLMGHPSNKPSNYWLYMRGMIENWEGLEETALREFHEESGIDISEFRDRLEYLGMIEQRKGKNVVAYALAVADSVETVLQPFSTNGMFSNMCCGGTVPEIDGYKWMTLEEVVKYTNETNIPFYTGIVRNLGKK